ncbi:MAG: ABC transporter permease [Tannerella sp.]|jgi:ABC-type antimicrobial peptide transport system permease subunit|nr:ABC transporter permease [Tannerella sp.]
MIKHYLKIAIRQLVKYKTHYIFSIISIALGLLCFSLTTYYAKEGMNAFIAWPNTDRMANIYVKSPTDSKGQEYIPGKELYALMNNPVAGIEHVTWLKKNHEVNVTFETSDDVTKPFLCNILKTTPNFVSVYSVKTTDGKTPTLKTGEVFITESMAKKIFASENPVGKILYFTKSEQDTTTTDYYTISAVIKDLPRMTREEADLYFPQTAPIQIEYNYNKAVTVLLAKGIPVNEINKRLQTQFPRFGEHNDCYLTVETFYEQIKRPEYLLGLLFPLMGALILIAAMINFLKLCINDFYSRTRELGLRKNLGSTFKELFCLLFIKVIILLFFAVFATFILSELFIPLLYMYHPKGATALKIDHFGLMSLQLKFLVALFIISAGSCLWTVYRINKIHIINTIRNKREKNVVRNALLGIQVFIAFLFVGITVVTYIQNEKWQKAIYKTLTTKQTSEIWKIDLKDVQLQGREDEIIEHLKKQTWIEDITIDMQGPNAVYETQQGEIINGTRKLVSENYAGFMKLPLQGRMPHTTNEAIVSRTLIWNLEKEGASTDWVVFKDKTYQITGIYEALPFNAICSKEEFDKGNRGFSIITLADEQNKRELYVKSVSGQGKKAKENIQTVIRTWLPETIPFTFFSMKENQFMNGGLGQMMRDVFIFFTIIAMIIITFSLYSAITIDTETRKKEVAIRKINGAGYRVISLLFGKLYIRLLSITVLPALLIVYLYISSLTRLIDSGSNSWINNPLLWISIILLVTGIVFITVIYHIRSVSRLNPAEVIKTE